MAEGDQVTQTGDQDQQNLGWRSALPDEYKEHEWVKTAQKPGDFVKSAIEIKTDRDALKAKLDNTIPKLPENATDQEREVFYLALGRPEKADGYEFPEGDGVKHDEKMVSWARDAFYKANLSKDQGKVMSQLWDGFIQDMVKAEIDTREKERTEAETKLKTELGDKYDGSVEMVRRVWKELSNSDFDAFINETKIGNDARMIRFVMNVAKKIGSDTSIQSLPGKGKEVTDWYPKTKF